MRYLHEKGITNLNLKPENILFDSKNHPYISDFYLTQCFSTVFKKSVDLAKEGQINTIIYLAPEILSGKEFNDPSYDVYSFSMLAYYIITEKVPFSELVNRFHHLILKIKSLTNIVHRFLTLSLRK